MVAGGGIVVVVATGKDVVVEAKVSAMITSMIHLSTHDSQVTSDVTVTSPVTTARNPLFVMVSSVWSLTMMVVPVTLPGMGSPQRG